MTRKKRLGRASTGAPVRPKKKKGTAKRRPPAKRAPPPPPRAAAAKTWPTEAEWRQSGLCAEAQADGVPCPALGRRCEVCERALADES